MASVNRVAVLRSMRVRDSQTLKLPDGRVLGFAEYGHPQGRPVFFFHGFPTSRLEGYAADKLGRRHRLRFIAPDRPGFGLSTFAPTRRITDWPADVRALADALQLPRFAVLGLSGGGPYALACAHALPAARLSAVGVLAGAGPCDQGTRDVPARSRAAALAATYAPALCRVLLAVFIGSARWLASTSWATTRIDAWLESESRRKAAIKAAEESSKSEKDALVELSEDSEPPELTTPERREQLLRALFDGFSQGSGPAVYEAWLLSRDWGFRLEDVAYKPVQFWHGSKDTNAPIAWIKPMVQRVQHGVLEEFEGDTHYTIASHLETILMKFLPEDDKPPPNQS